jgi:serine/threonine protein phosphatase PrpC
MKNVCEYNYKLVTFTKENLKLPLPEEDSFRYLEATSSAIIAVADGITRDSMCAMYKQCNKAVLKILKGYPNPSPAKLAAEKFCESFTTYLKQEPQVNKKTITSAFSYANNEIFKLNEENVACVDYSENDYWGCVASGGVVINNTLYWGHICDCGVCVFDKFGNLKFRTEDDMQNANKCIDSLGDKWGLAKWRKEFRIKYRNNPNENYGSYGALTGEKAALNFVRVGKFELSDKDYVLFYSDGMADIIYSNNFKRKLAKNGLIGLEKFCRNMAFMNRRYEREGTLVALSLAS